MKAPKSLNKSLKKLDEIQEITDYVLHGNPVCLEFRKYITDLKKELEELSMERKRLYIRFAKKAVINKFPKQMTFRTRLKLGLKFIFRGEL